MKNDRKVHLGIDNLATCAISQLPKLSLAQHPG